MSLPPFEMVLYGIRTGDEDWQEEIITTDPESFDKAKAWAKQNGFDRFRVAKIDLTRPPDFTKTINM